MLLTKPKYLVLLIVMASLVLALGACRQKQDDAKNDTSQKDEPFVVVIQTGSPIFSDIMVSMKNRLTELGFIENEDILYYVGVTLDNLQRAVDFKEVDLFITIPGNAGKTNFVSELKARVGDSKPIVFTSGTFDPVAEGVADSLDHPNQNVTGVILIDSDERRFDLFHQLIPDAKHLLLVYNPEDMAAVRQLPAIQALAASYNIQLSLVEDSDQDREHTLQLIKDSPTEIDGIFLLRVFFSSELWLQTALDQKLAISQDIGVKYLTHRPTLIYGPLEEQQGEQVARLVDQILRGQKPGNLPIENADMFLILDQGVADRIGLDIPQSLLEQASIVNRSAIVGEVPSENARACLTTVEGPGGSSDLCFNVSCEEMPDIAWLNTDRREDIRSCSIEQAVGICRTLTFNILFYSGGVDALSVGCTFGGGIWTELPITSNLIG